MAALFITSGDMLADRRYALARDYAADGDLAAAADLYAQAAELCPGFASAWFALGEAREALGDRDGARSAFARAQATDPEDRHGAALHLARLGGAADPATRELHAYVRTLFDQYAPRFDRALADLGYRAPALLRDALLIESPFRTMLDLGCGTGLAGAAFRPHVDRLVGVDLSAKMIDQARAKGVYDTLSAGDIAEFLAAQYAAKMRADLIIAADVFAYIGDICAICASVARVLSDGGRFGFTVETHAGEGAIVGPKMRYQHSADFVRTAIADAGMIVQRLDAVSTRNENRVPVPGLLVIAGK